VIRVAVTLGRPLEGWQARCVDRLRAVADVHLTAPGQPPDPADLSLAFELMGAVPSTAGHGTLTFLHGDPPSLLPIGWREVADRAPTTTCRLILLRNGAPKAVVLRHAVLQTAGHSVAATARRVEDCCVPWPAQLISDLVRRGAAALRGPMLELPSAEPAPSATQRLRCAVSAQLGAWRKVRELATEDTWGIGIVDKPAHAFLADPRPAPIRWLPELVPEGYHADPFPIVVDGRPMLLAEGYDHNGRKGYLALLDPDARTASRLDVELSGHLSYPQPIEDAGRLLLLPESHQARQVVLLRPEPFPTRWVVDRVLLDDFAGVDCTPVQHDGRWWLFCADNDDRDQDKLFLFMADRLDGPWQPHPQNPVKVDCRSSRPGGRPFLHDGVLYRPAQDCSQTYGGALVVNRVLELTPDRFAEEVAARIEPDSAGPYPDGLHHFASFGDRTIIDGNRQRFGIGTTARWLSWRLRSRSAR
jgi:hypothetical protein